MTGKSFCLCKMPKLFVLSLSRFLLLCVLKQ